MNGGPGRSRALVFHAIGGPEVLSVGEIEDRAPRPDQVVVRVRAAGLNFADTRFIRGQYFARPTLPDVPGMEVAGEVLDIGTEVTSLSVGDRVVAFGARAFAERMVTRASNVFRIPPNLEFEQAAAIPVQGLTAHHLLNLMGRLSRRDRVLIHAAAGGVGVLAIQLAKASGATVTASCSTSKHALARELGADHVVDSRGDVLAQIKATTGEVDLILEMVGGTESYKRNLAALAPLGRMVVFGAASGDTRGTLEPVGLMSKNLSVVGYYLTPLLARRDLCERPLDELTTAAANGSLRVIVGARYSLAEARKAFEALESRETTGKIVLSIDG
ncbi:MAG: NADPH:quinone oxidoreductase family protein [Polyangiaceae bacterium]